jgi:hypothetical protein
MFGIGGYRLSTFSSALACAITIGGCNVAGAPGSMQLGLIHTASRTTESVHPSHHITNAMVVITEIDANVEGTGWVPIMTQTIPVDLLHLDDQTVTALGIGQLPMGRIDRLRMVLDPMTAFVVDASGARTKLTLPKKGIVEVVGKLDLDGCTTGTMILDFDPKIRTSYEDECGDRDCDDLTATYRLRSKASIRFEEVHGQCPPGGGPSSGVPCGNGNVVCAPGQVCSPSGDCMNPPAAGHCGNGNVVCAPGQLCMNGDCIDLCAGVSCGSGEVCMLGICVSTDQCIDSN